MERVESFGEAYSNTRIVDPSGEEMRATFPEIVEQHVQRALAASAAGLEGRARLLLHSWGEAVWTARDILPPLEVLPGPGPLMPRLRLVNTRTR